MSLPNKNLDSSTVTITANNWTEQWKQDKTPINKFNTFQLTPLEKIQINKQMPKGYKLELPEFAYLTQSNNTNTINNNNNTQYTKQKRQCTWNTISYNLDDYPITKPLKQDSKPGIANSSSLNKLNNTTLNNKRNAKDDSLNKSKPPSLKPAFDNMLLHSNLAFHNINPSSTSLNNTKYNANFTLPQKWEYVYSKIKSSRHESFYDIVNSKIKDTDEITMVSIEKNIINKEYSSPITLLLEFKRFYVSWLPRFTENNGWYESIRNLISSVEVLIKEIQAVEDNARAIRNKNIVLPRQMNLIEKETLTNLIRGLPEDQLKGIVQLLNPVEDMIVKSNYYELDIEKWSNDKWFEVERYVKSCLKSSKNFIPQRYQEGFNLHPKIK